MALAESNNILVKLFVTSWAVLETILLSGVAYGWASFVFILKDEGIYSHLCTPELSDVRMEITTTTITELRGVPTSELVVEGIVNGTNPSMFESEAMVYPRCTQQDSVMSLCFTITVFVQCTFNLVMGQVDLKLGTMVSRLISL